MDLFSAMAGSLSPRSKPGIQAGQNAGEAGYACSGSTG